MTKPSTKEFHFIEGVYRFEKHGVIGVHRLAKCTGCDVEPPLPDASDISLAIETGRNFVAAFGAESGDYWPDGWIEIRTDNTVCYACPTCDQKVRDVLARKP